MQSEDRGLVSGLFGLSLYGCYGIWVLHNERLRLGLEALQKHEEVHSSHEME